MGDTTKMSKPKVIIGEESGEFTIVVGEERFRFEQEDSVGEEMIRLFKFLGYEDVVTEKWY